MRYLLQKTTRGRVIPDDPVDEFFSALGQFIGVLAMEGEEFSYIYDTTGGEALKIVCKDPSRQVDQRLEGFHTLLAMSANLDPMAFFPQMLVFDPERTDQPNFPPPFPNPPRPTTLV